MAKDVDYLVEEDEYATKDDAHEVRLVVAVGKARSIDLVPLALTVPSDLPPISVDGLALAWSKEALSAFARIRDEAKVRDPHFERNLPYASLRGFMEIGRAHV